MWCVLLPRHSGWVGRLPREVVKASPSRGSSWGRVSSLSLNCDRFVPRPEQSQQPRGRTASKTYLRILNYFLPRKFVFSPATAHQIHPGPPRLPMDSLTTSRKGPTPHRLIQFSPFSIDFCHLFFLLRQAFIFLSYYYCGPFPGTCSAAYMIPTPRPGGGALPPSLINNGIFNQILITYVDLTLYTTGSSLSISIPVINSFLSVSEPTLS